MVVDAMRHYGNGAIASTGSVITCMRDGVGAWTNDFIAHWCYRSADRRGTGMNAVTNRCGQSITW